MDEATIVKAKLLAAVICRVVDYYTLSTARTNAPKGMNQEAIAETMATSERAVAVALENFLGLE